MKPNQSYPAGKGAFENQRVSPAIRPNRRRQAYFFFIPMLLSCCFCRGETTTSTPPPAYFSLPPTHACRIIAGREDRLAAESLAEYIRRKFDRPLEVIEPTEGLPAEKGCFILLGTMQTNECLARIARQQGIELDPGVLTEDGYVVYTVAEPDRQMVLAAGGGKRGVFYAVGELKNYYLQRRENELVVLIATVREIPVFKYRWFWTWDWRMNWGDTEPSGTDYGGGGPYRKKPESFLADYKPCIDFMAENGVNGLIIFGFIRDAHGGEAASRELCRYSAERGVQVLPGVGTSDFNGYFYEGDHPYHTPNWLRQHPELKAVGKNGKILDVLCPSQKANQDWLDEGARWLFANFEIGGAYLEIGDFFVCYCEACQKARAAVQSDEPEYYKQMAISHCVTLKTMRKLSPAAWLSYATYTGFDKKMMTNPPKFIEMIPSDSICQWSLTKMVRVSRTGEADEEKWPPDLRAPTTHGIGLLPWGNYRTGDDFFLQRLQVAARKSHQAGLEGLVMFGELPVSRTNTQLNYLAFREFGFHPEMTMSEFMKKRLAPLYGTGSVSSLEKIIDLTSTHSQRKDRENLRQALDIARAEMKQAREDARRHWQRMIEHLESLLCKYAMDIRPDGSPLEQNADENQILTFQNPSVAQGETISAFASAGNKAARVHPSPSKASNYGSNINQSKNNEILECNHTAFFVR